MTDPPATGHRTRATATPAAGKCTRTTATPAAGTGPVLVVEDDANIMELIRFNLGTEGFSTLAARSGEQALAMVGEHALSLILLDIMLPGIDGLAVCRMLKSNVLSRTVPLLMVSARGEEADIVTGLELGAEDYITKPFSPRILVARVKAVLRRHGATVRDQRAAIGVAGMSIHPGKREVRVGDAAVRMTTREFEILRFLAEHPGWVFTRDQLVTAVHGPDYPVTDRSVDVLIAGVRKKLGGAGTLIETVRGVGYRFSDRQH